MVYKITCTKCHKKLPLSAFYRRGFDGTNGHCSHCKDCRKMADRTHKKRTPAMHRQARYKYRYTLKEQMIAAYGGKCMCCGETEYGFLTLDHIFNDGKSERDAIHGGATVRVRSRLRRLGWPRDRYQLLCFNCNCGRAANYGICPHKQKVALRVV